MAMSMTKGMVVTTMVAVMKTRMKTRPQLMPVPRSKTTTAKPAPVKTKSCKRDIDKEQDEDGRSDSGVPGPADSVMDSSPEEEADDEVDGMLGEQCPRDICMVVCMDCRSA
jgi:hypothetical protein